MTSRYVRTVPRKSGSITLVGVVHGHPASEFRAHAVTTYLDPDILALELPPLAIPLFRELASTTPAESNEGGEMRAAIRAANTEKIVGIDGPSLTFLYHSAWTMLAGRPSVDATLKFSQSIMRAAKEAAECRIAATGRVPTSDCLNLTASYDDISSTDVPERQAEHEGAHASRALAIINAFGTTDASHLRDHIRESHMVDQLDRLGDKENILAIVGLYHLDSIVQGLQ